MQLCIALGCLSLDAKKRFKEFTSWNTFPAKIVGFHLQVITRNCYLFSPCFHPDISFDCPVSIHIHPLGFSTRIHDILTIHIESPWIPWISESPSWSRLCHPRRTIDLEMTKASLAARREPCSYPMIFYDHFMVTRWYETMYIYELIWYENISNCFTACHVTWVHIYQYDTMTTIYIYT